MKSFKYLIMFVLLLGLSITARNQETKRLEAAGDGPFIVKAVYVDKAGVKWFGTNRGLCRYNDLTWRYYTDADYLVGNQINALTFEEPESGPELWVATTEGVSVVAFDTDGVTGSTSYTTEEGLLNNDVNDVAIDSRHGKFFGSADGITWFHDGIMDSILYAEYYANILSTPVRQMDVRNDTLYIAQDGGIGRLVSGVDGITGASRWTSEYGVTPYSGDIYSVLLSQNELKYFGCDAGVESHSGSFAKQNWDLLSTENGLVNDHVISIAEDAEGGMWFGTLGGVSHLDDGSWTSYTTSEGLLNDTVYDIAFDLDGATWFATGAGACRLKNGVFEDFITALPDQSISPTEMLAWYNKIQQSLHLEYQLTQPTQLTQPGKVSARLYNLQGMLVASWKELSNEKGPNHVDLPLPAQSSSLSQDGIYVIQLIHGSQSKTRKLLITN